MAKIQKIPAKNNPSEKSFFEEYFVEPLKLTEKNNRITAINPETEPPAPKQAEMKVFEEDRDGNVRINYCDLDRKLYVGYTDAKNPKPVIWHQKRLKAPIGDNKYWSPKGMPVRPFVIPLIPFYEEKAPIRTLLLTEGAKKGWVATMNGAPTVGLTSITTYKDKETGGLHHDVVRLVEQCQVEHLVFVVDSDARDISEKELSAGEDITNRPGRFYAAAKQISALAKQIGKDLKVYFYQVDAEQLGNPKGLDDLLIAAEEKGCLDEAIAEILDPSRRENDYFQKFDISSSTAKLQEHFCLGRKDVSRFYRLHAGIIQDRKFVFNGDIYQWDEGDDDVREIAPGWSERVFYIDNDWYEVVEEPVIRKDLTNDLATAYQPVLKVRKKSTLSLKYGKGFDKKMPPENFFDGFCSVPSHTDYNRRVRNSYNIYWPIQVEPKPGNCDNTLKLVRHIFGKNEVGHKGKTWKMWELGLDYLTILLRYPLQLLPVLVLYSPENQTGKSTFARLLSMLFGNNILQVNNNDFQNPHNEHFAGKLMAICEETLLDKLEDIERIKNWSTAPSITINPKGRTQYTVASFCKFQLYSNRKRMIHVTDQDDRFWMLKVPVPEERDVHLEQKMREEIPAFLHLLLSREISVPQSEDRMWFPKSLYLTDLFWETVAVNEPQAARDLRSQLEELFHAIEGKATKEHFTVNEDKIFIPTKEILKHFFRAGRVTEHYLAEILKDHLKVERYITEDGKSKTVEGYFPAWIDDYDKSHNDDSEPMNRTMDLRWIKFNGRPWVFERANFKK